MATPLMAECRAGLETITVTPDAEAGLTREHLSRLLDLARALAGASRHADLAGIAAERARGLTGASLAQVIGLREGAPAVLAVATDAGAGARPDPAASWAWGPARDVLRSGEPAWVLSRAEASERWPDPPLDALAGGGPGASWAFLPLVADDEVIGVLALAFRRAQPFDPATRSFLGEVAAACGAALASESLFDPARAAVRVTSPSHLAGASRRRRRAAPA